MGFCRTRIQPYVGKLIRSLTRKNKKDLEAPERVCATLFATYIPYAFG
jgi:hypothetical protein